MSILGTFQPDTLTTGVAPCRSAEFQVTVSVCDSPGNSVMSLPCQIDDCSSLSPDCRPPVVVPRRTSARRKNATAEDDVFVIVTVVATSAPSGPDFSAEAAVAETADAGRLLRPVRSAYADTVPTGWPSDLLQSTTSGVVDSQYTLRSMTALFCRSSSSTK